MLKRYQHLVGGAFRIMDVLVVGFVWLASYWLRFYAPIVEPTKGFPGFSTYAALTPLVVAIWFIVFTQMRVYEPRRMLRRTHEAHLILRAHFVAMIVFIAMTYLITEFRYSRMVIIYFGVLGGFLLVAFRLMGRNTLRALRRKGHNLKRVLVVGEGPALERLIYRLGRFPELGLDVIGAAVHQNSKMTNIQGKEVIGRFQEIPSILREKKVDQLVICLPREQYPELDTILKSISDETIDIQMIPDIHEYVTLGCEVEDFEGLPLVNLNDSPLDGWGAIIKRFTDVLFVSIALVVLSPFLILIGLLVKITSRGPVLYTQERMGLDGRTFPMIKFRTMFLDAEKKTGAVWARKGDDRRTLVGKLLRATSLDELPQLWNILKGDMSLVGPRPERPVFVDRFRGEIPGYMLRHKVKAGLTGWAQVHGWRGDTSLDRRIEFDLYYVRNWSYLLDLKILLMTLWKGFINKNAY